MPIKGVMTKLKDGRDAIELVEEESEKPKKRIKVFSDGRGGVYQMEFDFERDYNLTEDQVAPI
tara:strand:+ start:177 stop:365 length:189 start_codon:yes stop_codon:yes gene_type:complete